MAEDEIRLNSKSLGSIRIKQGLISVLSNYRQLTEDSKEAGGIILGKHLRSGGAMLLDGFTPPQPTDLRGRCSFFRSNTHSQIASDVWRKSNGEVNFLGLWHTHPEPYPNYSSVDIQDWRTALRTSDYYGDHLVFLIVGQMSMRIWIGKNTWFRKPITLIGEIEL